MGAEAKNAVCTAVVLAAGRGTRMGISQAKQYLEIGGKPMRWRRSSSPPQSTASCW